MSTYSIEHAKSGRAKCAKCKEIIAKDEIRIGITYDQGDDRSMTRWNHPKCFVLPRALVMEGATAASFCAEDLNDPEGILDEHLAQVIADIEYKAPKKAKASEETGDSFLGNIKRNYAALYSADAKPDAPAAKKIKPLTDQEQQQVDLYEKYKSLKTDDLKNYLRWNKQIIGGTKDVLLLRVMDGELHGGRLSLCPMCNQGKLKINEAVDNFCTCSGYYDEESSIRMPSCGYKIGLDKAPRWKPFYTQAPTQEQEDDMNAAMEKSTTTTSAGNQGVVAKLLQDASDKVDYKVSSKQEMKDTATAMVALCRDANLAFPEGEKDAKNAVLKIVVAEGKTKSASKLMQLIIDQYGFADDKAALKAAASDSLASLCKFPGNAPIVAMLKEYAALCFQNQDKFKGAGNIKAANAVMQLAFEVTEENAPKLGKAGKLKQPGIGKGTAEKMLQFLKEGKVDALEELKASVGK